MKLMARPLVASIACVGLVSLLTGATLAQSDPQVGVWKLNVAKSTSSPLPAPKSATTTIEAVGTGAKVVVDQVAADGTKRHWEFTADYDGKDSPVTGNPDVDTVARTRTNPTTVQTISKKGGKVIDHSDVAVSSDGKTRTVTTKGVNASGQQVNNVGCYEKQ